MQHDKICGYSEQTAFVHKEGPEQRFVSLLCRLTLVICYCLRWKIVGLLILQIKLQCFVASFQKTRVVSNLLKLVHHRDGSTSKEILYKGLC